MSEAGKARADGAARRLADAIRDVKNAAADRNDVVVELREASRMRLDLLAGELAPVFDDVPAEADLFDFTVSSGLQPRLWIDAVSHVAMGRDRRTYQFVRDTRIGRVVVAQDSALKPIADQVTRYIAERLIERQRLLDGAPEPAVPGLARRWVAEADLALPRPPRDRWTGLLAGLGLAAAGALAGFAFSAALFWDRFAEFFSR